MFVGRLCLIVLLAFPLAGFAQKKQIQELQRDMALMQDEVRSLNEKLTNLTVLVEQVLDKVNKTNTTVAVLDSSLKSSLKEQQKQMAVPLAGLNTKVDQMSDQFRFVRESVADLNSRIGRVQTQITDLRNAMQIMAAPPPPPSGNSGSQPVAGSAETLFSNARRDQSGGKADLALAEYQDFLKAYPNTDLAPAAQYNIGEILYRRGEFDSARKAFDLVLEKYPENDKTVDAMFMKAKCLVASNQKRSAAREFRALIRKYPDTGLAEKAKAELKKLGY